MFVEVKAGRAGTDVGPTSPVLAVGPQKQRRLRRLARAWLATEATPLARHDPLRRGRRHVDRAGRVDEIEWIRNAF